MHSIKITPNLLFEYQCTSGKFNRLPNRIESKNRFGSENRIESNRNFFLPELKCSSGHKRSLCFAKTDEQIKMPFGMWTHGRTNEP